MEVNLCVPTCLYAFNRPFSFFVCNLKRVEQGGKTFSKSLLHSSSISLSALVHPNPIATFASVAKFGLFPWWRYWTVSQINCQCPGHFMVPLIIFCAAGVGPRSCGAAIVIEASLGYRWIVRSVGQSLAVIARVGGEALLQQSEQGPGCLILVLHAARCMLGECITNSLPSLPLPLCKPCFSLLLTSL